MNKVENLFFLTSSIIRLSNIMENLSDLASGLSATSISSASGTGSKVLGDFPMLQKNNEHT